MIMGNGAAADNAMAESGFITAEGKSWQAFPGWNGPINFAIGNVNADAKQEIVVAPGQGGGPIVRIFNFDGRLLGQFNAYNPGFRGGVNLAVGDVNSDEKDEIITGAGPGGGPHVRVFNDRAEVLNQWFAYSPWLKSGVLVDVKGGEVITLMQNQSAGFEMPMPFHRQEHALSCEAASLKSALNYKGVNVSESKLISLMPQSYPMEYEDGVWGDPSKGYVGDINGSQPLMTGYGVYWDPIKDVAAKYRPTQSFRNASWQDITEYLLQDNAVVIWGNLHNDPRTVIWQTTERANVLAFMGEHTYVVLGWQGSADSPDRVILLDPLYGRVSMGFEYFLKNWSHLSYSGIVIE